MSAQRPSFDLVLATVGRAAELQAFLESLARQESAVRVLLVDQNDDDRLVRIAESAGVPIEHLRSAPGLSRARNCALPLVAADIVAFPDDDCLYPPGLLDTVADRFAADPSLAGLTGRAADRSGRSEGSWEMSGARLTQGNLWNRAISFSIFLRRQTVEQVGAFDERLGLGSGTRAGSGEEIDYLLRAVGSGLHIVYDPDLVVWHPIKQHSDVERRRLSYRDGVSIGLILRTRGSSVATLARMLIRPAGGILLGLVHGDLEAARLSLVTLRGRLRGFLGAIG